MTTDLTVASPSGSKKIEDHQKIRRPDAMTTYTLFLDQWNSPPNCYRVDWIIARCIDEAIEMSKAVKPDMVVFGNSYFEEDFIDWMVENRLEVRVDFVGGSETEHRAKVAHLKI